jgi:predicted  nucleic acid-binding Zn-ribbon protein
VLEDELLEAMMAHEEARDAAQAAIANRDEIQRRTDLTRSALVAERDRLKREHETLTAERQALRSRIPDTVVDSYDYLYKRTGSRPVAVLKGDVCSVCGMVVTMPIRQQVNRGQEAYCNNCRRLLVG